MSVAAERTKTAVASRMRRDGRFAEAVIGFLLRVDRARRPGRTAFGPFLRRRAAAGDTVQERLELMLNSR
jgi:hypothetical protein